MPVTRSSGRGMKSSRQAPPSPGVPLRRRRRSATSIRRELGRGAGGLPRRRSSSVQQVKTQSRGIRRTLCGCDRQSRAAIDHLADLLPVLEYAPSLADFDFSFWIKTVGPAPGPDFTYDDLEGVADGIAAASSFRRIASGADDRDNASAARLLPEPHEELRRRVPRTPMPFKGGLTSTPSSAVRVRAVKPTPQTRHIFALSARVGDGGSYFSLAHDVAAANPAKLKAMQTFMKEAEANHVLPIDDRSVERLDARTAGRPDLMGGRTSLTLYPGMSVNENSFINLKNTSTRSPRTSWSPKAARMACCSRRAASSAAGASI